MVIRFCAWLASILILSPPIIYGQSISFESMVNNNRLVPVPSCYCNMPTQWGFYSLGQPSFSGISNIPSIGLGFSWKFGYKFPAQLSVRYREAAWESGHKSNSDLNFNDNYYKFLYPFHSVGLGISYRLWQSENKRVKWYAGLQFERPGLGTLNKQKFYGWHIVDGQWRDLPGSDYLNLYSQVSLIRVSMLKTNNIVSNIEYALLNRGGLALGLSAYYAYPRRESITVRRPKDATYALTTASFSTWSLGLAVGYSFGKARPKEDDVLNTVP